MRVKIRIKHGTPLDTIQDQNISDMLIYISNQVFRLKELSGSLSFATENGSIVILPKSSNEIYIQEKHN